MVKIVRIFSNLPIKPLTPGIRLQIQPEPAQQHDIRYWFVAIHLLTSTKESFSASELQRRAIAPTTPSEPHKLRLAVGERDTGYSLIEVAEIDEVFFHRNGRVGKGQALEKGQPKKRARCW